MRPAPLYRPAKSRRKPPRTRNLLSPRRRVAPSPRRRRTPSRPSPPVPLTLSYDLQRPPHAGQPAREPDLQVSRLGFFRRSAGGYLVPGLYSDVFPVPLVSGTASAGHHLFRSDAPQSHRRPGGGDARGPGAGFAFQECAGDVRDRQDAGRIFRRFGGHALRRGPSFRTPGARLFLLLLPSVLLLGAEPCATVAADPLRPAAHAVLRPAECSRSGFFL